jgi:hypothetical protein
MEAFAVRAVAHHDRLTPTEHRSELRARLLLSIAVLTILFAAESIHPVIVSGDHGLRTLVGRALRRPYGQARASVKPAA